MDRQKVRRQRERILEAYRQGLATRRIARELGIDRDVVRAFIKRYEKVGDLALEPYRRKGPGDPKKERKGQKPHRVAREEAFSAAFDVFANTLEPVSSIARRYGLDCSSFRYHIRVNHPELVEKRESLKRTVYVSA